MVLLFSAIDGMSSHFLSEAAAAAFACSVLLPFYFWIPFFLRMWIDFHWFSLSNINISWQLRRERWTNTQLQSSSMYYIEQREAETTTTMYQEREREGERKKERKKIASISDPKSNVQPRWTRQQSNKIVFITMPQLGVCFCYIILVHTK